jgi:hypothetical protein
LSRRRELPPLPPGYVRSFLAAIVCTGRQSHAEARLADVSGAALPGEDPSLCWVAYERGDVMDTWMAADGMRTYTFRCRRCPSARGRPRTVPLTELHLMAAVIALEKAGQRPVLDVSLIPT